MTSPLLKYINAYLLAQVQDAPELSNGRIITNIANTYLIRAYMTRQQSTGTTTGADYIPGQTGISNNLPGTSGMVYLYAGYAISYVNTSSNYDLEVNNISALDWIELSSKTKPSWLTIGLKVTHRQGNEPLKYSTVERISGRYGNTGIDEIINQEIGGIPIILRSGELID